MLTISAEELAPRRSLGLLPAVLARPLFLALALFSAPSLSASVIPPPEINSPVDGATIDTCLPTLQWSQDTSGFSCYPTFEATLNGVSVPLTTDAVGTTGRVVCWGNSPTAPSGTYKYVNRGDSHACALRLDDTAYCWGGSNNYDELDAPSGVRFQSVHPGGSHTCGLRQDGRVICWGRYPAAPTSYFVDLDVRGLWRCGVQADLTLACWSWNGSVMPAPAGYYRAVTVGENFACGLGMDDVVRCFDEDGLPDESPSGTFRSISAGHYHACGVRLDGTVACWGSNSHGESSPPSGTFLSVSGGRRYTCGVRTSGIVSCWGTNADGQSAPPGGLFLTSDAGYSTTCGLQLMGMSGTVSLVEPRPLETTGNEWTLTVSGCDDGTASATSTFDLSLPLEPPTVTEPPNGASVYCDATISWEQPVSDRGLTFDVQGTDGTVFAADVAGTSWTPTGEDRFQEGTVYYRVVAKNCVGETAQSGAAYFQVNNAPLTPLQTLPAAGGVVDAAPTFSWETAGEQHEGVRYSLVIDGDTEHPIASDLDARSYTLPATDGLGEGGHTWEVVAVGCYGAQSTSGTRVFTVDATGPTAFFLTAPGDRTWLRMPDADVTLSWTSADDMTAGLDYYAVVVDGAVHAEVDSTQTDYSLSLSSLAEGAHLWSVIAYDRAGNATPSDETRQLGLDMTAPDDFALRDPPDAHVTDDPQPTLAWEPSSDALSGIAEYQVIVDGGVAGRAPGDAVELALSTSLDDGVHEWFVIAVDAAGNERESATRRTLEVDTVPPRLVELHDVTPRGSGDWVSGAVPRYRFSGEDNPGGSGLLQFEVYIDGSLNAAGPVTPGAGCAPDTCQDDFDIRADGAHTWFVTAIDRAGNAATSEPEIFIVETQPPFPFEKSSPQNGETVEALFPLLCWNAANDDGSGVVAYELTVTAAGGGVVSQQVDAVGAVEIPCARVEAGLSSGTYAWQVTAFDAAGNHTNADAGASWALTVAQDETPPVAQILEPATDGTLSGCVAREFRGTVTDDGPTPGAARGSGPETVEVRIDDDPWTTVGVDGPAADSFQSWSWAWEAPTSGSHTLYVRAIDREGNVQTIPASRAFDVDCSGPAAFSPTTPEDGEQLTGCVTFGWESTTDERGEVDRYELHVLGADGEMAVSLATGLSTTHTLTEGECLGDGSYTWNVVAYDTFGNGTESEVRSLLVDGTAPDVGNTVLPAEDACVADSRPGFTWEPCADAGDIAGYTVYVDDIPVSAPLDADARETTSTDALSEGEHSWYVRCVDRAGNQATFEAVPFRVDVTPPATEVQALEALQDGRLTLRGEAHDPNGCGVEEVEVRVDGAWGAADHDSESGEWTFSFGLATTDLSLDVRAIDGAGNIGVVETVTARVGSCWTVGVCDPLSHDCSARRPAGTPCDDMDACTEDERCSAEGVCADGVTVSCDDEDTCTTDSCDSGQGCVYENVSCDDGDICTEDGCDARTGCTNTPLACDDDDACTADSCDSEQGCLHTAMTCDDEDACTDDACDSTTGCTNTAIVCEDDNPCTDDACEPASGCVFEPNEAACEDDNPCTTTGCQAGECAVLEWTDGCCVTIEDCETPLKRCDVDANQCESVHCMACTEDADCGDVSNVCVAFPSGDHCLVGCPGNDDTPCLADTTCEEVEPDVFACVPVEGDCVCVTHDSQRCHEGDVYWFDSCSQIEEEAENCDDRGCVDSACCPSGTHEVDGVCENDVADPGAHVDAGSPSLDAGSTGVVEAPPDVLSQAPDTVQSEASVSPDDAGTSKDERQRSDASAAADAAGRTDTGSASTSSGSSGGCSSGPGDRPESAGLLLLIALLALVTVWGRSTALRPSTRER